MIFEDCFHGCELSYTALLIVVLIFVDIYFFSLSLLIVFLASVSAFIVFRYGLGGDFGHIDIIVAFHFLSFIIIAGLLRAA